MPSPEDCEQCTVICDIGASYKEGLNNESSKIGGSVEWKSN